MVTARALARRVLKHGGRDDDGTAEVVVLLLLLDHDCIWSCCLMSSPLCVREREHESAS